jgi:hypothetical protein
LDLPELIAICEKIGMDENQVGKKRRARRSGEEVERLVEEFVSSGMKSSEFCRTRSLLSIEALSLRSGEAKV